MEDTKLEFDEEGLPIGSGWVPPIEPDYEALENARGMRAGAGVDMERLLAMPARDTFLWRYLHMVLKKYHNDPNYKWRPQYQKFGTCVGQAAKLAVDQLMAINAILYNMEFPGRASVAGAYTFARVEVEGRPGRGEGANGVNAATAFLKLGVLLLKHIGLPDDERDRDEQLALQWTRSREGVPQKYEEMAGNLVVQDVIHPKSVMEAAKLIQAGSPQFVGTTYIPTGKRNSSGLSICKRGRLGHEQCVDGVIYDPMGNPDRFHQQNSWDLWGEGGVFPEDMPPGGVWISARDYAIQMADGDVSSIIGINGLNYNR